MTDELNPTGSDREDTTDQPTDEGSEKQEPNPWLREGADAADAADIEDPIEQG